MKNKFSIIIAVLSSTVILSIIIICINNSYTKKSYNNREKELDFPDYINIISNDYFGAKLTYTKWQYPKDETKDFGPIIAGRGSLIPNVYYNEIEEKLKSQKAFICGNKIGFDLSNIPDDNYIQDRNIISYIISSDGVYKYLVTDFKDNKLYIDLAELPSNVEYYVEIQLEYKYSSYGVYNFKIIKNKDI